MGFVWNLCSRDSSEYEHAANALAVLACPDGFENPKRDRIFEWFCGRALIVTMAKDPAWANKLQLLRPCHMLSAAKQAGKTDFGPVGTSLRHRMAAARMAMPFFIEAYTGEYPKLPHSVARPSINQMAQLCMEDAGQSEVANVKARVWAPSRPVIHFACAIAVALENLKRDRQPLFTFDDLLVNWPLMEAILQLAEEYETLVEKSSDLHIQAGELVRLRIACALGSFQ